MPSKNMAIILDKIQFIHLCNTLFIIKTLFCLRNHHQLAHFLIHHAAQAAGQMQNNIATG